MAEPSQDQLLALFDARHPHHRYWSADHKARYAREWLVGHPRAPRPPADFDVTHHRDAHGRVVDFTVTLRPASPARGFTPAEIAEARRVLLALPAFALGVPLFFGLLLAATP